MGLRIIRKIGFPYEQFRVFLAIENGRKLFIIKRNNKIVFRTKDSRNDTKREVFKMAKELGERSIKRRVDLL